MTSPATPPQPAPVVREWSTTLAHPDPTWITAGTGLDTEIVPAKQAAAEHNALARAYLAKCTESDARLTSWAECRGLLSKARAEVDGLTVRLQKEMQDHMAIESKVCDRTGAAEARAAKLLEALEMYGRHDHICPVYQSFIRADACTCGLHKALAAAKGEK